MANSQMISDLYSKLEALMIKLGINYARSSDVKQVYLMYNDVKKNGFNVLIV